MPLRWIRGSQTAPIPEDGGVPANNLQAAVGLLGLVSGQSFTEQRSTGFTKVFTCRPGSGQFGTQTNLTYLYHFKTPRSFECQKITVISINGIPAPAFGVGDTYQCNSSGEGASSPTPSAPVVTGSNYWGPAYVCAAWGTTGEFFGVGRHLPYGYPTGPSIGRFRQASPSPDPRFVRLWEEGVPLQVPAGTLCDARSQGRVNGTTWGSATPVPAGWAGFGFICNPSGSRGQNGDQQQVFLPTYASNLGYWPGETHTVMYYNGMAWVVPRQDVCV